MKIYKGYDFGGVTNISIETNDKRQKDRFIEWCKFFGAKVCHYGTPKMWYCNAHHIK